MKAAVETFNQSKQQSCDEFEAFGKFLASELRSLDDIAMARRIKRKVNRFFLDAIDEEQNIINAEQIVVLDNSLLDPNGMLFPFQDGNASHQQ